MSARHTTDLVSVWRSWAAGEPSTPPCRSCRHCWSAGGHRGRQHSRSSPPCWRCGECAEWACKTPRTFRVWPGPRRTGEIRPHTVAEREIKRESRPLKGTVTRTSKQEEETGDVQPRALIWAIWLAHIKLTGWTLAQLRQSCGHDLIENTAHEQQSLSKMQTDLAVTLC